MQYQFLTINHNYFHSYRFAVLCRAPLLTLLFVFLEVTPQEALGEDFLSCRLSDPQSQTHAINNSQTYQDQTQRVLHILGGDDLTAYFGFTPKLTLIHSVLPNAYAIRPNEVILSTGLIDITKSEAQLAFILAHELGHLVLHTRADLSSLRPLTFFPTTVVASKKRVIIKELEADAFALRLLRTTGFSEASAVDLMDEISAVSTELFHGDLQLDVRIQALQNRTRD